MVWLNKNIIIISKKLILTCSIIILIGLDGQSVIIFGGIDGLDRIPPEEALYVLNLTNFNWFVPKTTGQQPGARFHHRANVIGKYMFISFGKYSEPSILFILNI